MLRDYAPYATALFELAKDQAEEKKYMEQLKEVSDILEGVPEFKQVLSHPNITNEKKKNIVSSAFKNEIDETVYRFIIVLNEHKVLSHLKEIYEAYVTCYQEKYNIEIVKVTSAIALDDTQIEKLKKALEDKLQKNIKMNIQVDPSLIAGLRVQTKDMVMDNTVVSKIDAMKEAINR